MFETVLGKPKSLVTDYKMKYRTAVKAVIIQNGKILLMHSNRGDYKFPGGGVEEDESLSAALIREVAEETGYIHCHVKEPVGIVIQRHPDLNDEDTIFEMTSHYFHCELSDFDKIPQQLEGYESELEMAPRWITMDEAIDGNEMLMDKYENNRWIKRENYVLEELKKLYE
ncbi:NUDIX hydrolase [Rossellomorea vietnamensis]|uniref:NUDIX hydrolase n=1 Tax=Rossellomorea vietnamensis TaxID=218284 RepID=UPI000A469C87|nr:NUDIX domain-containing protein [Rossellomorea vietnamensis]